MNRLQLLIMSVVLSASFCVAATLRAEIRLPVSFSNYWEEGDQPKAEDAVETPAEEADADEHESFVPAAASSQVFPSPAKQQALNKAAAGAYKVLFYDNNFQYVTDPAYGDWHLGENIKRLPFGCNTFDFGGEYRARYHSEHNLRLKPLTGHNDDFLLHRTRLYANAQFGDRIRLFGEAVDATSNGQNYPPRAIEANRFDALNLFADYKLLQDIRTVGDQLWIRGGRQELLYSAQRLVSPLDWSNTRRTFDGVKMFYQSKKWNVDAWWTRPVPFGQHMQNGLQDHNFDHPNRQQDFVGAWATYKCSPGRVADFYFLRLDDYSGLATDANGNQGDADFNLFASRYLGKRGRWLYEYEGGYQWGEFGADDISAGFFTVGLGREAPCMPGKPTVWAYYDWASGDDNPLDNEHGTFNQYFPLGHKYLGFMDIVARQNIQDANVLGTLTPHKKTKLILWYHVFHLSEATDALYNAGGRPIYQDPTGGSGTDIGQELDLLLQWTMTARTNLWVGYSHFWAGDYFDSPLIQTPGQPAGGIATNGSDGKDSDFLYTQFTVRF